MKRERRLREGVHKAYSEAATHPEGNHLFPVGRQFAESLGYPSHLLDELPPVSAEAFTGVSNVALFAQLSESATVLDLGCGAGLDSLIASRRLGPRGCVIAADFSEAMLERASKAIRESRLRNVELLRAAAENLPLRDASIDVALVNGIFNLNPARELIFQELARVVRPGGEVDAAELILKEPLPPEVHQSEADWFAWVAGAKEGGAFLEEFRDAGFREASILRMMRNARTKSPRVLAAEVRAQR